MGLVAATVDRLALLVHRLALAQELVDRRAIGRLLCLREGGGDVIGTLVERALLEIDRETLKFVGEIRLRQRARVRVAARDDGLGERGGFRVQAADQRAEAERRVDALVVRLASEDDRAEQLGRRCSATGRRSDHDRAGAPARQEGRRSSASWAFLPRRISLWGESAARTRSGSAESAHALGRRAGPEPTRGREARARTLRQRGRHAGPRAGRALRRRTRDGRVAGRHRASRDSGRRGWWASRHRRSAPCRPAS
jgi:hypothetical protein